jgi:hypothetical protein
MRFIDDGGIELDNNTVEFAGSDRGAEHWATIASLIETCKLNDVDPLAYLAGVLTRIINGHPNSDVDRLLPWAYRSNSARERLPFDAEGWHLPSGPSDISVVTRQQPMALRPAVRSSRGHPTR